MVGKFKTTPSGCTHLPVVFDKFRKCVEAKPTKKCDGMTTTKFLHELIYRYGFPHIIIITNNGTNFKKGGRILLGGEHPAGPCLSRPSRVEHANNSVREDTYCWVEELPSVLWGISTSINRSTGFTPFFMVYGAKTIMPTDLEHNSM
jgi:hypothetical protein